MSKNSKKKSQCTDKKFNDFVEGSNRYLLKKSLIGDITDLGKMYSRVCWSKDVCGFKNTDWSLATLHVTALEMLTGIVTVRLQSLGCEEKEILAALEKASKEQIGAIVEAARKHDTQGI